MSKIQAFPRPVLHPSLYCKIDCEHSILFLVFIEYFLVVLTHSTKLYTTFGELPE